MLLIVMIKIWVFNQCINLFLKHVKIIKYKNYQNSSFIIFKPIKAAPIDIIIVRRLYKEAEKYCSLSIIKATSKEKAENVVKPPKNPVIKNKRKCWGKWPLKAKKPAIKPINKHPIILINNAPIGALELITLTPIRLNPWRRAAPNPPRKNTI